MKKEKKVNQQQHHYPNCYMFSGDEAFEMMVKGTEISKKLTEVIIENGSGLFNLGCAVYGLAKVTVLIEQLAHREGYDITPMFYDVKRFWNDYCESENFERDLAISKGQKIFS